MVERADEEKEFEDEIDYGNEMSVKDLLRGYKHILSLKTHHWKREEQVPAVYEQMYHFRNIIKVHRGVHSERKKQLVLFPGSYIRITIQSQKLGE